MFDWEKWLFNDWKPSFHGDEIIIFAIIYVRWWNDKTARCDVFFKMCEFENLS